MRLLCYFMVGFVALICVSCSSNNTVLSSEEGNLHVTDREFHSTLYFPNGEALHYPGYLIGVEKSYQNKIGGAKAAPIADLHASYLDGDKATSKVIEEYEDDPKSLFVSHIIRYGRPKVAEERATAQEMVDQCLIYNAFESRPKKEEDNKIRKSLIGWRHCDSTNTQSTSITIHDSEQPGAKAETHDITSIQAERPGFTIDAYKDSLAAFKKLECGLAAHIDQNDFTHLVVLVMGWNTSENEAIRNFNDIIGNMLEASRNQKLTDRFNVDSDGKMEPAVFRPLVIGVTWPSFWSWPVANMFSYANKADDADELGLTWLNVLVNRTIPLIVEHARQKQTAREGQREGRPPLRVVLIGHSFGARAGMRALFSGPLLTSPDGKVPPLAPAVDLAVGLQGAVSIKRFGWRQPGGPYRDFDKIRTKIALTASEHDSALPWAFWADSSGKGSVWKKACFTGSANTREVFDCWTASDATTYSEYGKMDGSDFLMCDASKQSCDERLVSTPLISQASLESKRRVMYIDTSNGITKFDTPETGGGAHSDIYRHSMGSLLWTLTQTYARYPSKDEWPRATPSLTVDARNAATACTQPSARPPDQAVPAVQQATATR